MEPAPEFEEELYSYPEIGMHQSPPISGPWRLPTLHFFDKNKKERIWIGFFDGGEQIGTYYGQFEGKKLMSLVEVVPKVKRDMLEQAHQEIMRKFLDKKAEGYYIPSLESFREVKPMLAEKYDPKHVICRPVYIQCKLDGKRLLTTMQGPEILIRSREGRPQGQYSHLYPELQLFFNYLPVGCMLDGELYNHDLRDNFQKLIGAAQTTKNVNEVTKTLQYYLYDIDYDEAGYPDDKPPYEVRFEVLQAAYKNMVLDYSEPQFLYITPCFVSNSEEDDLNYKDLFKGQGYEGAMVKLISSNLNPDDKNYLKLYKKTTYIHGRGRNIMKLKDFYEVEATIVGVAGGKGGNKGVADLLVDWNGQHIKISPVGYTKDTQREWFKHPELVVGKLLTVVYFETTADGLPRFPKAKAIRDYE